MAERRVCSFCGAEMEPGTGKMYVKRDGTILNFDTSKCYKNMIDLGRVPRRTRWTRSAATLKATLKAAGTKETKVEIPAVPTKTKATTRRSRKVRAKVQAPVESNETSE
ncbi:MAG TPA: 50S ribosomal protein L24e [Methanomassiliicoccaceae archaeon]|jgi:large subunit ribosomal protein L24e|nr:hypothetical protein [Euryarchaeota archaeon]HOB39059.1 50S ribosomal protein L24e [Methanomassiliicoccaceae archaeon]HOK28233.1 50S ribosomal protein L24e [Methanomassiliicoccaceae archaeon]HOL07561.1 50S ribosomal protein L24e [Methanomassiliicoccaceae archaeon]HOQ26214.1 50S ribosomal protein L24e [Methanomassiliicoccaceae archaeon]